MQDNSNSSLNSPGTNSLRKLRRDWWKTRLCTSCVSPLGRIISRGGICPQCGLRVCKNCRSEPQPSGAWVCVLCTGGGISPDNLGKTKSLGRDSRSIRRSWTISNPQRAQTNSPVLKSYTILHPEESLTTTNPPGGGKGPISGAGTPKSHRQFHSLPRMSSESDRSKKAKRSFNSEFEKENIKRHRSFQTTLHPYQPHTPPSPSASINFIEDPFWDYYDYDIESSPSGSPRNLINTRNPLRFRSPGSGTLTLPSSSRRNSIRTFNSSNNRYRIDTEMDRLLNMRQISNSNRSSCERSLGEAHDYDYLYSKANLYSPNSPNVNHSNFNSFSDTELNDTSKYSEEQRRFSTENPNNFYRFATVTPINMSPMDSRKETEVKNSSSTPKNNRQTPVKPERKCNKNKRSFSLNSFDGKRLFSPLRTYVVVMKENVVPRSSKNIISDSTNATSSGEKNTSSIRINSEEQEQYKINQNTKFNSLPRERVIRIEREDWRFAKPAEVKLDLDHLEKNNKRNVSKVEISRSVSSASTRDIRDFRTNSVNPNPVPSEEKKISRSQSYREISSTKQPSQQSGHYLDSERYNSHTIGQRNGKLIKESANQSQKPLLSSLLDPDDKKGISVMENFLRSQTCQPQSPAYKLTSGSITTSTSGRSNSNEKSKSAQKAEVKKTAFVSEQTSDFEQFQRQQIQTFDNYLRQCSTFPRAIKLKTKSEQEVESEPKRHTSTTIINSDDANKTMDSLDSYFNQSPKHSSVTNIHKYGNERVVPIVHSKNSNVPNVPNQGWSATLPHPYIRRHKQEKSSFSNQDYTQNSKKSEQFSPSINDIEREIERDIYFQKTRSLDRRPNKSKPIFYNDSCDTRFENVENAEKIQDVPVASPRLKRKAKLLASASNPNPKINTEQSDSSHCVIGSGTNYPNPRNKNKTCMPNEPRPQPQPQSQSFTSLPVNNKDLNSILEPQFNTNQSKLDKVNKDNIVNMKFTPPTNNYKKVSGELEESLAISPSAEPPPIATPRTRRKNQDLPNDGITHNQFSGGDTHANNGKSATSNLNTKAVRFEPHVIEMEIENERKHNKARNNGNINASPNINISVRMNNNTFNGFNNRHLADDLDLETQSRSRAAYHYISGKGHYSFHHGGVKNTEKSKVKNGFVARAIAKVKSKARITGNSGNSKKNFNSSNSALRVETRDSITYISPPPTGQKQEYPDPDYPDYHEYNSNQEITQTKITQLSPNLNNQAHIANGINRSESFAKTGILKNDTPTDTKKEDLKDLATNTTNSAPITPNRPISPPKPRRSSLKMQRNLVPPPEPEVDLPGNPIPGTSNKFLGLSIDQQTPSSSSSSSSSYLSNLQESYDFFNASEECESVDEESDSDGESVFKSFDDDEDAGEDFIFYSQIDNDQLTKSRSKSNQTTLNRNANLNNNNCSASSGIPIVKKSNQNHDYCNNATTTSQSSKSKSKSQGDSYEHKSKKLRKGLVGQVGTENNGKDDRHHQNHHPHPEGVDSVPILINTDLPAVVTPRGIREKLAQNQIEDFEVFADLKGQFKREQYGIQSEEETERNLNSEPKSKSNLLLPSSFITNSQFGIFSQSEFFPGNFQELYEGGVSMGDNLEQTSTSTKNNNAPNQKFKSSVLVNPSQELNSSKPQPRPVSPSINDLPLIQRYGKKHPNKSKNVTTVDISGDVGIVSTSASEFLNNRRLQLKKVNNESLWKNDVYSSGLSQLGPKQSELNQNQNNSQLASKSKYQQESTNGLGAGISGASASGSGSNSDGKIESVSSGSDDGDGSDWHSESTKNTVIFRGERAPAPQDQDQWAQSGPPLPGGFNSNYDCDPEIHISSITLVDNYDNETGSVTPKSKSPSISTSSSESTSILSPVSTPDNKIESKVSSNPRTNAKVETEPKRINKTTVKSITKSNKSLDDKGDSNCKSLDSTLSSGSSGSNCDIIQKGSQGVSASASGLAVSEVLTGKFDSSKSQKPIIQMPEELEEMVQYPQEAKKSPRDHSQRYVPSNSNKTAFHQRRESPEGQEQEVPSIQDKDTSSKKVLGLNEVIIMEQRPNKGDTISKSKISQNALNSLNQITASSRSSPDGADADRSEGDSTTEAEIDSPTPMIEHFDVTSDEDSWVEEIIFEDDDSTEPLPMRKVQPQPPPLDLTLHTIVEESCEESEPESGNFNEARPLSKNKRKLSQNDNELEKYFNFGINQDTASHGRSSFTNDESEFSDTFSESSFSMQDQEEDLGQSGQRLRSGQSGNKRMANEELNIDPAELASSRLEKYFYNLGLPQSMINPISSINQAADSDSVGSESESDNSVLDNRKKVLKHHRRSADFEDELGDKVSDDEEDFFGQDGFDTIKKTTRKVKKSGSDSNLLESCGNAGVSGTKSSENILRSSTATTPDFSTSAPSSALKAKVPLAKSLSNGNSSSSKEESSSTSPTSPCTSKKSMKSDKDRPVIKVNRSNSFQWSSDEEVNIMMSKLRQLIRNLVKAKPELSDKGKIGSVASTSSGHTGDKDKQLQYLENELIRLMKTENLKNIVEYFSSEESDVDDVYKFIKVVKESGSINSNADDNSDFGDLDLDLEDPNLLHNLHSMQSDTHSSPKGSPALLAKVMHHIGNRLAVWMKDENLQDDDNNDDTVTLKCAQSVSSDLNEDRFSWKGSFESALAAKRQSVGSTDSISSSDFTQDRSILRSSSLHHLANSSHHLGQVEENKEEEETASSLPRMTNLCNSLPRLNQPSNLAISRAHSLVMSGKQEGDSPGSGAGPIKSARYRPPGFQPVKSKRIDDEGNSSNPLLSQSTPMLTHDPGHLKVRSDSMGSIFHDTKPHISVKGQVEFGLQYNYKLACLEVRVKQCRDLAAVDNKRNRSDPYVKAYLLPDRSKGGKRKTKIKKNTLNPAFEEILKFPLTLSDLQNRTLWLSVWHSDIFGKNEFLGEVLVDLKDRVFDDPNPQYWDLQEMSGQTEDMPRGDVVIALKWQPKTDTTGNLSVLVKEAKNLVPVKNGSPSSFIKCSLLTEKSRKHKTSICRRSYNPVWNQTLTFEDADDEGLEITLWNHDLLSNHDLLGTARVEYDNPLWASMLSRHSFWVEGVLRLI